MMIAVYVCMYVQITRNENQRAEPFCFSPELMQDMQQQRQQTRNQCPQLLQCATREKEERREIDVQCQVVKVKSPLRFSHHRYYMHSHNSNCRVC